MEAIKKLIDKYGEVFVLNLIYSGAIREYMNTRINADMRCDIDKYVKSELFKAQAGRKKEISDADCVIKISFIK